MSWSSWQSSIGSLAKTALKHAQINIDRVLEIPEVHVEQGENASVEHVEQEAVVSSSANSTRVPTPTSDLRAENDGFFSMFGVGPSSTSTTKSASKSPSCSSLTEVSSRSLAPQDANTDSRRSSSGSNRGRHDISWSEPIIMATSHSQDVIENGITENVSVSAINGEENDGGLVLEYLSKPCTSALEMSQSAIPNRDEAGLENVLVSSSFETEPVDVSGGRLEILFQDEESEIAEVPTDNSSHSTAFHQPPIENCISEAALIDIPLNFDSTLQNESSSEISVRGPQTQDIAQQSLDLIVDSFKANSDESAIPEESSEVSTDPEKQVVEHLITTAITEEPTVESSLIDIPLLEMPNTLQYGIENEQKDASNTGETNLMRKKSSTEDVMLLSYQQEVERLRAVLSLREEKLIEISRENAILKELKDNLQSERETELETQRITYAERILQLEKKLQSYSDEKFSLTEQLKLVKEQLASQSKTKSDRDATGAKEIRRQLEEKETVVRELMEEGEKLSKQNFQSANHIKKLKIRQTELESENTKLKNELEDKNSQLSSAKNGLTSAGEEDEKKLLEIKHLNANVERLEKELSNMKNQLDENRTRTSSLQAALDAAYKELADLHRQRAAQDGATHETLLAAEITAKEELRQALDQQRQQLTQEQEELSERVLLLQSSLSRNEAALKRREESFREELAEYQQRLQEASNRNEELAANLSQATRPLLRQNEALQKQLAEQASTFDKLEQNLNRRLQEALAQLLIIQEKERSSTERLNAACGKQAALETQLSLVREERQALSVEAERDRLRARDLDEKVNILKSEIEKTRGALEECQTSAKVQRDNLEHRLALQVEQLDMERRKNLALNDQLADVQRQLHMRMPNSAANTENVVVSTGLRRSDSSGSQYSTTSTLDGQNANRWSPTSSVAGGSSLYDVLRGASTPMIDGVQSQLRLKEGELQHLRGELRQLDLARQQLAQELIKAGEMQQDMLRLKEEINNTKANNEETNRRYHALLQMYGEKVEELEEIRLDYADMRETYKAQIDALTRSPSGSS